MITPKKRARKKDDIPKLIERIVAKHDALAGKGKMRAAIAQVIGERLSVGEKLDWERRARRALASRRNAWKKFRSGSSRFAPKIGPA